MRIKPQPEELGWPIGSGVLIELEGNETHELAAIIKTYLPDWLELFAEKNRKYAGLTDNELGAKGKFVDVFRKTMVLKSRLWDGHPVVGEDNAEVIKDTIGHLFLMLYDLERG